MKEYIKNTNSYLKSNGVKMSKMIHGGGLFSMPVFDVRKAYSWEEISGLTNQGFGLENADITTWNLVKLGVLPDIMELTTKIEKLKKELEESKKTNPSPTTRSE